MFNRWTVDPDYLDAEGKPLELPVKAIGAPSFSSLVKKYGDGANYKSVLKYLCETGNIELTDYGYVRLLKNLHVTTKSFTQALNSGATSISWHLDRVISNLEQIQADPNAPRPLETKTFSDFIRAQDAPYVIQKLKKILQSADREVTETLVDFEVADKEQPGLVKAGAGYYVIFIEENK